MKISLNWIKKYVPDLIINDIGELTKQMTIIGLDIESVESQREKFNNFVVAEVIEKSKHPNADKLSLCKVYTGNNYVSVVCGAPNVDVGQKVCLAKIGAIIPNGNFEIKKSKIRGELSEGMICAEDELGLSDDHSGILVLKNDAKIGMDFADYIGANDYIFDIGITPNRGDLLSHFGVAREISAIFGLKFLIPEIIINEIEEKSEDLISITIENPEYCRRFTGRVVKNVKVKESPEWLKSTLLSIGLRPRNNIVDITNFVMFETGQPLHAFDYDKIRGKKIIVRTASEGDKFVTLDSKERVLNEKSLMVCDAEGYSAIAGIMGGEYSEITNDTKNVFIESAYFDSVSIRKNSKRLGLQTDASQRFERGVDIEVVEFASHRAAILMQNIAEGKVCKGLIDNYPKQFDKLIVKLRTQKAIDLLGKDIDEKEIISKLEGIGIQFIEKQNKELYFQIPEFRRLDITREVDLIEEIARLYGYEYFENQNRFFVDNTSTINDDRNYINFVNTFREHFIGRGFNEIITYSQQDEKKVKLFNDNFVSIQNPISVEMNAMRTNLRYGMLNAFKINHNYSGKDISIKLFEFGRVFSIENNNINEKDLFCFGLSGNFDGNGLGMEEKHFDVYDIKGELEMITIKLNLENYKIIYYYSGDNNFKVADIISDNEIIGSIYRYSNDFDEFVNQNIECFICELNAREFFNNISIKNKYKAISKFPLIKRDIAFLVDSDVKYESIESVINSAGIRNLKDLRLFDLYESQVLGVNKKSLAITLTFGSDEKTLTDEEVNKYLEKIIKLLDKEIKIQLRDK